MEDVENVESIKIREDTKRRLIQFRARLEAKLGRKVSLDEAISYLLDSAESPDVEELAAVLAEVRRLVKPGELTAELRRGRSEDEAGG
ncbi:hypothetical protein TUZN_0508 [Thermoproteus uzoniensis 768-20]|uniref:VapB-type antitoxin n=1 Tax=Thermoproteus uzoniensis (strain 768-20) TaxID=999630 RepID=F2L3L9_THEU7|nr:hypothetical protein TUZN_0508 [Thermoproteus uzoniensis 768-20]